MIVYLSLNDTFIYLFSFRPLKKIFSFIKDLSISRNIYLIIIILFIIGVLIRSILPLLAPNFYPLEINHLTNDAASYSNIAIDIIENHHCSVYMPPGFSFILSFFYLVFGYNITLPVLFLIFISSFLGIIAYLISLELFDDKTAALLSLILIIINPILIMQAPMLLSDTLALLFFGFIILLLLKDYKSDTLRYSVIIGLLIGCIILIRSNYIYLGIVCLFFILLNTKNVKFNFKLKKIALFLIGGLIIISPWMYYTYTETGQPTISANTGINFFIGNNPQATGWYISPKIISNMTYEERGGKEAYIRAFNYLSTDSLSAAQLYIKKIYISIFEPYSYSNKLSSGITIGFIILNITYIITELWGILGLIQFRKNLKTFYLFLILILLIYLTLIIFFIEFRFVIPLIFIFTIFGSYYIVTLYKKRIISDNEN